MYPQGDKPLVGNTLVETVLVETALIEISVMFLKCAITIWLTSFRLQTS